MKFKILLLVVVTFTISTLYGQESYITDPKIEKNQTVINFLAPGITHEFSISSQSTLMLRGQIYPVAYISKSIYYDFQGNYPYEQTEFQFDLRPSIDVEYRNYYNLNNRNQKNKQTKYNSANFISVLARGMGPTVINSNKTDEIGNFITMGGVQWGIQRNYGKRFNFQLAIGPGVTYDYEFNYTNFTVLGDLYLGFRLGK